MIEALALLGLVVLLMWKSAKAGSDNERANQSEKAINDAAKAAHARNSVDAGNGVPVSADKFNRDNLHSD